tara:strand:+ start:2336 stop:2893 length:558 start_codon:yes stop_codon:yes gene_type:complete
VYARPIQIYKNIDNTLKFVFKNQDQKRIHIDGYTITMSIFGTNSFTGNQVLVNKLDAQSYSDDGSTQQYLDDGSSLFTDGVVGADYGALLEPTLTILDDGSTSSTRGVATVVISAENLANLSSDSYYYSLRAVLTAAPANDVVIYSDDNFGVRNTIEILSGHYTSNAVDSGNPLYSQQSDDLGSL